MRRTRRPTAAGRSTRDRSTAGAPTAAVPTAIRAVSGVLALAAVVWAAQGAGLALSGEDGEPRAAASPCLNGVELPTRPGEPVMCAHEDEAPPGVDVTRHVSTAELRARKGVAPVVARYANAVGVATPATFAGGTAVPCEDDGRTGHRTQAMYVVEAGKPNRFTDLKTSIQSWAAGVDDVVNRSAALTGGVRHVRFVTTGTTTCVVDLLNVTVPAGSLSSFGSQINAVTSMGFDRADRKYLMWTDASVLCGVANMYLNDSAAQTNPNNGTYAQFARVDTGCWGTGSSDYSHSTEAHELLHTLGGVQAAAPNATTRGHCTDESDTMCYDDGSGRAMRMICLPQREYFFDCNNDDYFSTDPVQGSYLGTHWNSANSRFLIGGGDPTVGPPSSLRVTGLVNSPAIPGLPTQAQVDIGLPAGRTVASVAWTATGRGCVFADPTAAQTTLTCPVGTRAASTVTAKVTDSSGALKAVSMPLTFSLPTAAVRDVTLTTTLDRQSGTADLCPSANAWSSVVATDTLTGEPVLGLSVTATKQFGTGSVSTAGRTSSTLDRANPAGVRIAVPVTGTLTTGYTLRATGFFKAATSASVVGTVAATTCQPILDLDDTPAVTYSGRPLVLTGSVTRTLAGEPLPLVGTPVTLWSADGLKRWASASTKGDGTFLLKVARPATMDARMVIAASRGTGPGVVGEQFHIDYAPAGTTLTAGSTATRVAWYGTNVTIDGTLRRLEGAKSVPLANATVTVKVTPSGGSPTTLGSIRTAADGSFSLVRPARLTGAVTLSYLGAVGQPAATAPAGALDVRR